MNFFSWCIPELMFTSVVPLSCFLWRNTLLNVACVCFCSRVMTYREHGAWVVKAHLQKETEGHIISVRYALSLSLTWPRWLLVAWTNFVVSSPALTEMFDSLSRGAPTPSTCCRRWRVWRPWTSTRRPTYLLGEFYTRRYGSHPPKNSSGVHKIKASPKVRLGKANLSK